MVNSNIHVWKGHYLREIHDYFHPFDTTGYPNDGAHLTLVTLSGTTHSPWVVVSVEHCWAEEVVAVLREGGHCGAHLTSIPHCWTTIIILVPWVQHLVGILPYEGVALHAQSNLQNEKEVTFPSFSSNLTCSTPIITERILGKWPPTENSVAAVILPHIQQAYINRNTRSASELQYCLTIIHNWCKRNEMVYRSERRGRGREKKKVTKKCLLTR